jgi:hypothetical protein
VQNHTCTVLYKQIVKKFHQFKFLQICTLSFLNIGSSLIAKKNTKEFETKVYLVILLRKMDPIRPHEHLSRTKLEAAQMCEQQQETS